MVCWQEIQKSLALRASALVGRDRAASALASSEALTFALRSTWAAAEFLPRGKGTSELSSQSAAAAPSLLSEPRRRLSLLPVAPSEGARKKSFFFAAVSETPPACVRGGWASSADACVVAQPFLRAAFEGLPRLLAADGGARSRTGLSGLRSERTERGEDSAEGATASRRGNNDLLSHPFPSPQNEAPQQMTGSSRLDGGGVVVVGVGLLLLGWGKLRWREPPPAAPPALPAPQPWRRCLRSREEFTLGWEETGPERLLQRTAPRTQGAAAAAAAQC